MQDDVISRFADAIVELQKRENTTIPFLQKQLDDIDRRINNVLNSIEEGIANASVKNRLDDLEMKKVDLEISIAKEKIAQTPLTKEKIVFWINRFKDGDINNPIYRRSLVDIFINSIFLYEDRIVITFNWKDGTKTVSLAEIEYYFNNNKDDAIETGNALNTTKYTSSHLDGNTPPPKGLQHNRCNPFTFLFLLFVTAFRCVLQS